MQEEKKQVMLSGVKPTGRPHIGNYFGAMKQWVDLQDQYKTYIFIPDYHALISVQDKKEMETAILDVAMDLLAIGINPEKVVLYKQSDVPVHIELAWIFSCLTTMPCLMRAHAFKDAEAKNKEVSVGLFSYPILMAADILMYDADVVPVGKDQQQHVEIARDMADKFNNKFGDVFKRPQALVKEEVAVVPGIDGQKMSKSYGNTIPLFAEDDEIENIISKIPMDSKGIVDTKNPDDYPIYIIYKLFANGTEDREMREMFEKGGVGYGEIKRIVIDKIISFIAPMREKRKEYAKNPEKVLKILKKGGKIVKKQAEEKMKEVRKRVGFELYSQ